MNTEEITAMLASIGVAPDTKRPIGWESTVAVFERFAALVAAKRDEENAQLCESVAQQWGFHMVAPSAALQCAADIRARGTKEDA